MKTTLVKIESKFHQTSMTTRIKSRYITGTGMDAIGEMEYEGNVLRGDDRIYCRRKSAAIKKILCGQSDCGCVFNVTVLA